jgi:NAD(P)H-quinone oxidoreductase subunit 5
MTKENERKTIGVLPDVAQNSPSVPVFLTRVTWLLWIASLVTLAIWTQRSGNWELSPVVAIDGLTVLVWVVVTFFSGIVHSYSRRYLRGSKDITRFFTRVFGFSLIVLVLVAANHVALFAAAWLAMGLVMADLIGYIRGWPQAQAAAALARRYFVASSGLLAIGLFTLWQTTGEATVSGILMSVETMSQTALLVAAGALLLAAMIQSALLPFHAWLLSSMTAPTPASALMHAGFVNAGGLLLTRFAPVVVETESIMLVVLLVGATSALMGKLLKSVQTDIKRRLGCSTIGQMGFMIMQAGLGFFGAAITHLVLHGFYKAYLFLSSGSRVEQTTPKEEKTAGSTGIAGLSATIISAIAGGALFAVLTGKGTSLDSGLLLTGLVVLTTLHATRTALKHSAISATARYGIVPLVLLPSIAIYAIAYNAVSGLLKGLPAVTTPTELTGIPGIVHGIIAVAFLVAYVAIETGSYRRSDRLYVALLNFTQPPSDTLLTSTEEYNEY